LARCPTLKCASRAKHWIFEPIYFDKITFGLAAVAGPPGWGNWLPAAFFA
jgi:hypothetical protein